MKALFDYYAKDVDGFEYFNDRRSLKKRAIDFAITVVPKNLLYRVAGKYYRKERIQKYLKCCDKRQRKKASINGDYK